MNDAIPTAPAEAAAPAPETPAPESASGPSRGPDGKFAPRPGEASATAPAEAEKPGEEKPAEAAKPPEKLSPRLAAIAKEEARVREARKAHEAKEKALAEREARLKAWEEEEGLRERDPLGYLAKRGISYEKLTEAVLTGQRPAAPEEKQEEAPPPKEVVALKQQLATLQKERDAEKAAAEAKQVEAYHQHVTATVKAAADKYELVNADPDGLDTVWAVINEHAKVTGKVLSPDEAAAKVEEALLADLERRRAVLTSKKVAGKLFPASAQSADPKPAAPKAASKTGPRSAVRTLSNSHVAAAPPAKPQRPLTFDERIAQAKAEALKRG